MSRILKACPRTDKGAEDGDVSWRSKLNSEGQYLEGVKRELKVPHRVTLRMVHIEQRAILHGWRKKIMKNLKEKNSEGARWLRGTELELLDGLHATLRGIPALRRFQ
ncbi:hypothetical protein HAX54_017802 [Datura stramonium]|uniref:Uncharacterized protein n=1 Tax=Datura stramonium TaxID=4076 RepID=A0ABS8UMH9_DATST|nr:hypothetical protein [Datura stramonium]